LTTLWQFASIVTSKLRERIVSNHGPVGTTFCVT
jgi:hypothetical protein